MVKQYNGYIDNTTVKLLILRQQLYVHIIVIVNDHQVPRNHHYSWIHRHDFPKIK